MTDLPGVAKQIVSGGKGIFAADASEATLTKRAAELGLEITDEPGRRRYRELLFTTRGLGQYVGGVIMHDESVRQRTSDGMLFTEVLKNEGIVPGVKVDRGLKDLALFPGEKVTEGIDGLRERLAEYNQLGVGFTKWRAVITIGEGKPTRACMAVNSQLLARYAALSQEAGMVPVVEPEVLMEGAHGIEKCQEATEAMARMLFEAMSELRVDLSGILYKTNMVVSGKEASIQPDDTEVAKRTVETLTKAVSVRVPGVVFLSGGQEAIRATTRLNMINQMGAGVPWRWTFSFERALEEPTMKMWQGRDENKEEAQKTLVFRAKMNSMASMGQYKSEMENEHV